VGSGENGENIALGFSNSRAWKWICNVRDGSVGRRGTATCSESGPVDCSHVDRDVAKAELYPYSTLPVHCD
jgi:hypothetical protein